MTDLYRTYLPSGGRVLDLMSSWVSHLPTEAAYAAVIGHGLNDRELATNMRLTQRFVQDLNPDPVLLLEMGCIDAALICVGVQHLQDPVAVLREVAWVLVPGGRVVLTFSNHCFPTKAVAIWRAVGCDDHARLIDLYLRQAGFAATEAYAVLSESWSRRPAMGSDRPDTRDTKGGRVIPHHAVSPQSPVSALALICG